MKLKIRCVCWLCGLGRMAQSQWIMLGTCKFSPCISQCKLHWGRSGFVFWRLFQQYGVRTCPFWFFRISPFTHWLTGDDFVCFWCFCGSAACFAFAPSARLSKYIRLHIYIRKKLSPFKKAEILCSMEKRWRLRNLARLPYLLKPSHHATRANKDFIENNANGGSVFIYCWNFRCNFCFIDFNV